MTRKVKMITETSFNFEIKESKEDKKLYIMGVFSSAEKQNKNGRVYPKNILEREINKLDEAIKNRTCLGQMGHPEDSPETDLEKASIITEDLKWKDNDVYGKARVLNTPTGNILKNLIEDNVTIGISSRGLGTVNENGTVNEDFQLLTYDIVANPSNKGSWVNGIYEGREFTIPEGEIERLTESEIKDFLKEHEKKVWQVIKNIRKSL